MVDTGAIANHAGGNSVRNLISVAQQPDGGISWPIPKPLPSALPDVPSLPPELLPETLRAWVCDIAERTQIPLDFVAVPAVTALSSLIGRRVGIYPKTRDDWLVVPNLWGCIIGRPGVLKTPALVEALKPLHRLARQAQEDHKANSRDAEAESIVLQAKLDAAKIDARNAAKTGDESKITSAKVDIAKIMAQMAEISTSERRYVVNDTTIEKLGEILNQNPRGVLLVRDELVGFLRSLDRQGRESDRAFYLEAWTGAGDFTYDRIGRGTLHIEALTVSIVGGMTPGKLRSYVAGALTGGTDDDGLLQRFQLAVWPDLPPTWVNIDRFPNTSAKNAAFDLFSTLDRATPGDLGADTASGDIPALRFSVSAQELFNGFRADLEKRIRTENDGTPAFESHLAKYRSLVPSLALIFHLVRVVQDGAVGPVSLEAAKQAAAWCEYLEQHARRIYAGELYPELAAAHRLAVKITSGSIRDGQTVRDVYRPGWEGLADSEMVTNGLRRLEELHHIRIERKATGGAPSEVIRINPALLTESAA